MFKKFFLFVLISLIFLINSNASSLQESTGTIAFPFTLSFLIAVLFIALIYQWFTPGELVIPKYLGKFWSNSFNFQGTSKRKDFWFTEAYLFLVLFLLITLGLFIGLDQGWHCSSYDNNGICVERYYYVGQFFYTFPKQDWRPFIFIPIYGFFILTVIPNISLQIRRLRDLGKTPLWIILNLIPFGGIILLIFYAGPSKEDRRERKLQLIEDLLSKGKIDEEEYKYMRKQILLKFMD